MITSTIFIFLALILYTFSIFTERHIGYLKTWIVILFTIGFTSDVIGTLLMFRMAEVKFSFTIHSFCGYLALGIMLAHLIWAFLSIFKVKNYQRNFTKYSIYAWGWWLLTFISGIPKVSLLIISWLS